ncbi:MAG: recombinase family protein [Phycisphaerae bacterium]|nr:recombinase family protein [Phycisphaerae bacterium]
MKAKIGAYLRVSTTDKQTTRSQKEAIRQWAKANHVSADHLRWYEDKMTGTTTDRPQLQRLLWGIDKGRIDTVVVFKLDRLSRSMKDGIQILSDLASKQVRVVSVSENIDFGSSVGRLLASILLAVASFERETTVERIKAGMQAAKANGVHVGRPRNDKRLAEIRKMKDEGKTVIQIAEAMGGITRQAVYSALARMA